MLNVMQFWIMCVWQKPDNMCNWSITVNYFWKSPIIIGLVLKIRSIYERTFLMPIRYKYINCPIDNRKVRLSGLELDVKGGRGNQNLFHQKPNFICDESALNRCKEKNCGYAKE